MAETETTLRTCTRCHECHPASFFNRDKTRADGVYPQCKNCSRKAGLASRAKHYEKRIEGNRRWKKENAERHREYNIKWVRENREKARVYCRSYRERFPEVVGKWQRENRDRVRENQRRWVDENRDRRNALARLNDKANPTRRRAKNAKYRASLSKATPSWADHEMIALIYSECPPGYDVDHIFPLKGKNSCGLHVVENLQYLPASENRRKSNKVPAVQEAW
jgi:hypothetical protein